VAVGVDRSVFPTILQLVRKLNSGRPGGATELAHRALRAFGGSPQNADAAFRHAITVV
jgi:hypothetical protein